MGEPLPTYDAPPVIETVLSAQFNRLASFTTAHAGWFWKSRLSSDWITASEAPRLQDQFERFGDDRVWGQMGFIMRPGGDPERIQITNRDDERMIQVQDSRFIYNWRKKSAPYPSYEVSFEQFSSHLNSFAAFAVESGLGELSLNQWEVSYINHIAKGDMWESVEEWERILPRFNFLAMPVPAGVAPDGFVGEWHFTLLTDRGRLHAAVRHAQAADGKEVLALNLTARGPVDAAKGHTLQAGLEIGHHAIVRTFTAMTSSEAHKRWLRRT